MKQIMNAPPGRCNEKEKVLWQKIQEFQLDDPEAALSLSHKLAMQQKWTYDFTLGAIEEYRKFIFLCCISPHGASPSKVIDEVWHLHLIYTQNYWEEFCDNTLQRKLHHYPSRGGPAQREKHLHWQEYTLEHYKEIFNSYPPSQYWDDDYFPRVKKQGLLKSIFQKTIQYGYFFPLLLLTGCNGEIAGFIIIPLLVLIGTIGNAAKRGSDGKKKDPGSSGASGGGCSSSSCGSSCGGGGCGGGCGGCGS